MKKSPLQKTIKKTMWLSKLDIDHFLHNNEYVSSFRSFTTKSNYVIYWIFDTSCGKWLHYFMFKDIQWSRRRLQRKVEYYFLR